MHLSIMFLREERRKFRFIGSGEHNSMGIGLAAQWVKEAGMSKNISKKSIIIGLISI
jgi:hypothetical protein